MKINFLLCLILNLMTLSTSSWGEGQSSAPAVVLLTSVNNPSVRPWFTSKDWSVSKELEDIFVKRFKNSGYRVLVKHQANQTQLWSVLHRPDVVGIFWLSHAGEETSKGTGLSEAGILADYLNANVAELFKNIHPNVRWISFVACNAKGMIERFKKEGVYAQNPLLSIDAYDQKVEAHQGLNQSINRSSKVLSTFAIEDDTRSYQRAIFNSNDTNDPHLKNYLEYSRFQNTRNLVAPVFKNQAKCSSQKSAKITITREIPATVLETQVIPEMRVEIGGKTIGIFPVGKAGEVQQKTFYIKKEQARAVNEMKVLIDSGLLSAQRNTVEMGKFSIQAGWGKGQWNLFANKKTGESFSSGQQLFLYKGDLNFQDSSEEFSEFSCSSQFSP